MHEWFQLTAAKVILSTYQRALHCFRIFWKEARLYFQFYSRLTQISQVNHVFSSTLYSFGLRIKSLALHFFLVRVQMLLLVSIQTYLYKCYTTIVQIRHITTHSSSTDRCSLWWTTFCNGEKTEWIWPGQQCNTYSYPAFSYNVCTVQ